MPPKYHVVEKDVRGIVLSSRHTTHGRISTENYGNVYFHVNNVCGNEFGDKVLSCDQHVIFNVIRGPKGFQANKIKVVDDNQNRNINPRRCRNRIRNNFNPSRERFPSYASYARDRSPSPFSTCSVSSYSDFDQPEDKSHVDIIDFDLRGEVNRYESGRGFGFISIRQYGSVFCHISKINGGVHLTPSQIVRCDVGRNKKGQLAAVNVRVIRDAIPQLQPRATSSRVHSPVDSYASRSSLDTNNDLDVNSASESCAVGQLGEVVSFNRRKKFGFIRVQGLNETVFVTQSGLKVASELRPNQIVKCDLVTTHNKTKAVNVVVVGEDNSDSKSCESKSADDRNSLCDICQSYLEDPVALLCNHVFCRECIQEWTAVNPNCPVDGKPLSNKTLRQLR